MEMCWPAVVCKAAGMGKSLRFRQIGFAAAQSFFGALALRDIDRCAHNFNKLSIGIQNGMAYGMDVFDRSIR